MWTLPRAHAVGRIMAEIPSDIAGSAAQSGIQAREVARNREVQRAGQANAAERQVRALDDADATVETEDNDAQVFTDAEGAGSQGRAFDEPAKQPPEQEPESDRKGITTDEQGRLHLDLEA